MQLTNENYLSQLENNHVKSATVDITAAKVQQATTIKKALQFINDSIDSGYLGQYVWNVKMTRGDNVSVRLETNLINLPMQDAKRLNGKLLDNGATYDVNLYMVIEGADVNKSGLRIDELATANEINTSSSLVTKFQVWVANQLAQTVENRKED